MKRVLPFVLLGLLTASAHSAFAQAKSQPPWTHCQAVLRAEREINGLLFSGDGQTMILTTVSPSRKDAPGEPSSPSLVEVWDVKAGKRRVSLTVVAEQLSAMALSPNGKTDAAVIQNLRSASRRALAPRAILDSGTPPPACLTPRKTASSPP